MNPYAKSAAGILGCALALLTFVAIAGVAAYLLLGIALRNAFPGLPPLVRADGRLENRVVLDRSMATVSRVVEVTVPADALPSDVAGADTVYFEADIELDGAATPETADSLTVSVVDADGGVVARRAQPDGIDLVWQLRCPRATTCQREFRVDFERAEPGRGPTLEIHWILKAQIRYARVDEAPQGVTIDLRLTDAADVEATPP